MSGSHFFRDSAGGDSPVHRLPAGAKLAATLAFAVVVVLVPASRAAWLAAPFVLVAAVARASRVPPRAFFARLAIAQPFVLGVALLALFQPDGLRAFAIVAAKSTLCVAATQLLAQTTRLHDLLPALRRARVPEALVLAIALLHRYLFVVVDESRRMRRARAARTWTTSPSSHRSLRSRAGAWRALASIVATSFVRSLARAERVAIAMRARGAS